MLLLKNNLKTFKKERIRRINATNKFDKKALKEWKKLITKEINKKDIKEIKFAFNFARKLKYNHGDSNLYFSHPLRVANMAVIHKKNIDINLTILALNHNILEVTNLSKKIFFEEFSQSELIGKIKKEVKFYYSVNEIPEGIINDTIIIGPNTSQELTLLKKNVFNLSPTFRFKRLDVYSEINILLVRSWL